MIASLLVFILIINLSLITWNLVQRNSVMFNEEKELRNRVSRVGDLLVRTPGYPEDWTAGTVEIPGFTDPDHVIDPDKMEEFDSLPYAEQSRLMRTRQSDFHVEVTRNGSRLNVTTDSGDLELEFGVKPAADADTVAVNTRHLLVNSTDTEGYSRALMKLVFWR